MPLVALLLLPFVGSLLTTLLPTRARTILATSARRESLEGPTGGPESAAPSADGDDPGGLGTDASSG